MDSLLSGSISHLLQLDPINQGSVLLNSTLFALKRENPDPILTVKIIEWRKFIDHFPFSVQRCYHQLKKTLE